MRILLLGADGQLGTELRRRLAGLGKVVAGTLSGRLPDGEACEAVDLTRPEALPALVARVAPALVVNAAAYTQVDLAEREPELAFAINAEAPGLLARACSAAGVPLVHFSTDYVFDGQGSRPWREDDPARPLGVYGASKLAGEQAVLAADARHLVFRLCWVYAAHGHNFLRTMLRLAGERERLRVVNDQRGAPTPAHWIADVVAKVLAAGHERGGPYHLAAAGECSWYEFACAIFEGAVARGLLARAPQVEAISTADYPTPARRPAWSRLDCSRLARDFGLALPDWRQGLDEVLDRLSRASAA
ncbi:dTDP-4-dehydrorhamnose reductase [Arenimonas fontis]|uniref:dTDP-4-dehydrorhamnose reductase n=1 Tax=Arenimonas fontis TaxID=2608255 RepID=A0A5B2ZCE9_9GAMM|nr:dTDP-4-dehydrorhamnose reductase [Arenimonas fontis]KAA2284854.1 dTDP-4-dehydrorhamnose reductase [Arenimonas fontis]